MRHRTGPTGIGGFTHDGRHTDRIRRRRRLPGGEWPTAHLVREWRRYHQIVGSRTLGVAAVPPAADPSGESFRGLLLRLRGRVDLTQRELAARMGVHAHAIQGWEAGATYPGPASLRALIAALARAGGLTAGREAEEAAALWAAAVREAPRLRTPFDAAWFDRLRAAPPGPDRGAFPAEAAAAPAARPTSGGARRQSWGEAPDVAGFVGRAAEREVLRAWLEDPDCRVVALLGLGGAGKTLLAA